MEGFLVIPFAGMPGEDIEDTIASVEVAYAARGLDSTLNADMRARAMALMLRNAMQDLDDNDDSPKSFVASLDKVTLNNFSLLSAKLKERFPVIKRERRKSRLQFFEEVITLKQQPAETVQEYVKRARRLAAGIEVYDQEALNSKFVQGIRNGGLRISVRTVMATKGDVATGPFETIAEAVLELADDDMLETPAPTDRRARRQPTVKSGDVYSRDTTDLRAHGQSDHAPYTPRAVAASIRSSSSRSIASVTAVGSKLRGLTGHNLSLAQLILIVAPSFILFGYNQAGVGGLLSLTDWTKQFPAIDTTHTTGATKLHNATIQGIVVAVFVLGALVGAFSCMYTGDYFGRRKNIFAAAILTLIGEAVCCSSFALAQFVIGRTIIGLGIGILSATVPVWQAECSSAANRGKHVVLDGLFITFGYTLEAWINLGFFQIKTGSLSWRVPLAIPCFFSLVLMASIFFMPESPRWLILVGRVEEGRANLSALKDLPLHHRLISAEVEGIQYSLEESSAKPASMMDVFSNNDDKLFYRFCLCILLQFYQQMSGSNLISVYAPVIFQQNLQLDSQLTRILTGGALTWKFLSSFIAFFTIDRYGRRALFMFSGFGMGSCMLALTICTSFPASNKAASIAGVFFIFMFNFFVPIGFLGANFLYCAEVAPSRLRVSMSAISTANHWLWNFVIVMVTPVAISSLGFKYFIVFAVLSYCIPASVYFFYPETMGQSLEQINAVFRDNKTPRAIVKAAKASAAAGAYAQTDTEKDVGKEIEYTHDSDGKDKDFD
ncbi:hypothetical protein BP5796_12810 [Coleophoma crateriformis]|uniref:Major facilitator superfamily (MFS) profile domain-containing protein n=1 Tax=Coleophoma crateriformis TaxID=565419 RepID=A0A3D8Q6S3_9HELO|nr:hypothetical protein BP5796_12810 [Coleophoma crateriformis]